MKINFTTIGCLNDTELIDWLKLRHSADQWLLMRLHLTLHPPHVVLQPPASTLEGIINCKRYVRVPFISRRRARNVDFATVRQRQSDVYFIEPPNPVPRVGRF